MECVTDIRQADGGRVLLLLDCCIQAYNAFDANDPARCLHTSVTPPAGFDLVDCWTGVDSVFGHDETVETYGLIFRSTTPPWRYVFAFRGTDAALDALDDCGIAPQPFTPFAADVTVPDEVEVEAGFNGVYLTGAGGVAPMQRQLFALLDRYQASAQPIDELCITGHSLGAALSQLFTLDVALSRPSLAISNVNFASPRVGNGAFVSFFEETVQHPHLRVQNQYDAVPRLPPEGMGFAHTSRVYLIAFYRNDWLGKIDLKASHSSVNYQAVIRRAAESADGVCVVDRLHVLRHEPPLCSEVPRIEPASRGKEGVEIPW